MLPMLSPSTLAVFSGGVAQSGLGQARPIRPVRAVGTLQQQSTAPATRSAVAPATRDGSSLPNRVLPRGSLLDLSV